MRDRLHWIVLRGTLLLLTAGGLLGVPLTLFRVWHDDSLSWEGDVNYGTEMPQRVVHTASHAGATWNGELTVWIPDAPWKLRLLAVLPDTLLALVIGYVALVLLLIVMNVQERRPFAGSSATVLRSAAGAIALGAVVVPVSRAWANEKIMNSALVVDRSMGQTGVGFEPDISTMLVWLLVSLLVAAAAKAFREGSRLARDVEGLV